MIPVSVNHGHVDAVASFAADNLGSRVRSVKVYRPDGTVDEDALAGLLAESIGLAYTPGLAFARRHLPVSFKGLLDEAAFLGRKLLRGHLKDSSEGDLPGYGDRDSARRRYRELRSFLLVEAAYAVVTGE